jgi:hypothetical protein
MKECFEHGCTLYSFMELKKVQSLKALGVKATQMFDVPCIGEGLTLVIG